MRGCSRVSPGCDECYAMKFAHRFAGDGKPYEGLTTIRRGKVDWSGRAQFIPGELDTPIRWRKPERVFVNSMSDLFHQSLANEQIAAVFGVMAAAPRHTFLVLTKRAERMREWFQWLAADTADAHGPDAATACGIHAANWCANVDWLGARTPWPLPNVHVGVSCENQETANERIPLLYQVPSAVRWVSAEPLLGPLNLLDVELPPGSPKLDWLVVGGESGPGARPFHVEWAHSLVRQCGAAGVPAFVKQLGSRPVSSENYPWAVYYPDTGHVALNDRKGGDMGEWPPELRVRQFPEARP